MRLEVYRHVRSLLRPLTLALGAFALLAGPANAGIFVTAVPTVDTYQLFTEKLRRAIIEVPDCSHSEFGPHITQQFDAELQKHVFAFHLHVDHDDDRCMVYDRQRTEISTYHAVARENDVRTYQWRFRIPEDYLPSTFWNHVFQLRPIDPEPGGNPVFTISMLSGEIEELLFYHDGGSRMEVVHRTPLAEFKGQWIDAEVKARLAPVGSIHVRLTSTLDGTVLLEWRQDDINLWTNDGSVITSFVLPKWGNYRSLTGAHALKDETLLYDEFCIALENETCESLKLRDMVASYPAPAFQHLPLTVGPLNPFPIADDGTSNSPVLRFLRTLLSASASGSATRTTGTSSQTRLPESKDAGDETDPTPSLNALLEHVFTQPQNGSTRLTEEER